ncbi:FG-GAP repeat domain-containing protein [Sorangium sp. So ce1000]|uniref:FG-GAP repeat domain-containing protein n=1 Tax=Sorangium sp. So ce1000 TaxID=3133325 RepID=UPI003F639FF1
MLSNRGDGTLGAPVSYAAYTYPGSVAAVDLNGDGAPDLVAANSDGGASVLLSACLP